jgi:threonine dehydrogenase-like Zn-dependent dehydrogenase
VRQLTCVGPGAVEWREVDAPEIQAPGDALVRPLTVARCEIDPFLVLVGPRAGDTGFALGHEAVAVVVAVGDAVEELHVGELVLPSFQVCCGICPTCRAGHTANCDEYPVLSDYGMQPMSGVEYGGMLSDLVLVPHAHAMLQPVPDGLDPVALASVPDNVADGYRAVAPHLADEPGADVLVVIHGTPSIGLYSALAAVALGAATVTVASDDERVLERAAAIGAEPVHTDFARRNERYPIVVDCGGREQGLHYAIASTQPEGTCHSVSYFLDATTPLPLGRMYTLGIHFHIGRAHSAALLPEVVALIEAGRLHPELVTTTVINWDDAADAYLEPAIKLVVRRDSE